MTIASTDLFFFAAQFPFDETYGGGDITATSIVTGTINNVFPDIAEADRVVGRTQLRKVYAAVVTATADAMLGSRVTVTVNPTNPNVDVAVFAYGDRSTVRSEAYNALVATFPYALAAGGGATVVVGSPGSYTFSGPPPSVGDKVALGTTTPVGLQIVGIFDVTGVTGSGPATVTLAGTVSGGLAWDTWYALSANASAARACGMAKTTATSGSNFVNVDRIAARVDPVGTSYPAATGTGLQNLRLLGGTVPIFRPGDQVLIQNGATSEVAQVARVEYTGKVIFTAALANSYATGTIVASLADLGDMRAVAGGSFAQQTWTRVFSDTLIGNSISASYNRTASPITITNDGAETERWAIVFTSATAFKLIGEKLGQIATGTTTANFAPLNPLTGQPYFTIPAAGWGSAWATGNVLRLNTTGARKPFWMMRTISPGAAIGADGSTLQLRGSV